MRVYHLQVPDSKLNTMNGRHFVPPLAKNNNFIVIVMCTLNKDKDVRSTKVDLSVSSETLPP